MTLSALFPGQGSQSLQMLSELSSQHAIIKQTFDQASDSLGVDLWAIAQNGPVERLNSTDITQPAMLSAGISVWRLWGEVGGKKPDLLAGHSLGEYTALVAANALDFSDAVTLVSQRASFMQAAVTEGSGAMAAILGMSDDDVVSVCLDSINGDVVEAVNFNSPGQVVIAGDAAAVERAIALASERGAKRAIKLPVSVPSHCSLMTDAAAQLATSLAEITIKTPDIPVLHNVDANSHKTPDGIRQALSDQLFRPVQWQSSIMAMRNKGIACAIEMGPGKVLTGLNRRIDRSLNAVCISDEKSLLKAQTLCED